MVFYFLEIFTHNYYLKTSAIINILFPEYTPHDDQYHLKTLFHVADTILGNQQLESMNSAELFILACSIYGHDWGMAVSDSEKHYIVTGRPPEGMTKAILEKNFQKFYKTHFMRFRVIWDYVTMLWRSPDSWMRFLKNLRSFIMFARSNKRIRNG